MARTDTAWNDRSLSATNRAVTFSYPEGRFRFQFLDNTAQPSVQSGIVLIQQIHLEQ